MPLLSFQLWGKLAPLEVHRWDQVVGSKWWKLAPAFWTYFNPMFDSWHTFFFITSSIKFWSILGEDGRCLLHLPGKSVPKSARFAASPGLRSCWRMLRTLDNLLVDTVRTLQKAEDHLQKKGLASNTKPKHQIHPNPSKSLNFETFWKTYKPPKLFVRQCFGS